MVEVKMSRDLFARFRARGKGCCPFCGIDVSNSVFKDLKSLREFEISGLCQVCQDETFEVE